MAHNTSRQAAAGYVRAQQLAGYSDWLLIAKCERCQRQGGMRVATLPAHWLNETVSTALGRLRCALCRGAPFAVQIERHGRYVALIGPGSY